MKNVVILSSSPRRRGNSATLANELARDVNENGGKATVFELASLNINPCGGCMACQMGKGHPCIQSDGMQRLYDSIPEADAVVFATPIYWQQMNGIMKNAIDRLFALAGKMGKKKDTALIATAATPGDKIFHQLENYFRESLAGPEVLDWNVPGVLKASGMNKATDAKNSNYMSEAYELGRKLAA